MPSPAQLAAFLAASVLFIALPGPSLLFALGRALSVGRRGALHSVVGNGLGLLVQVICVAVGLGALVAASATAYTVLKLVGAGYLVYLGIQAIRHRADARIGLSTPHEVRRVPAWRGMWAGFVVGGTNPKTIVFFTAFLPQFVNTGAPATPQLLMLGAMFSVLAIGQDSVVVLLAGTVRSWFARRPERLDRVGATGGVAMVGLGVGLAIDGSTRAA